MINKPEMVEGYREGRGISEERCVTLGVDPLRVGVNAGCLAGKRGRARGMELSRTVRSLAISLVSLEANRWLPAKLGKMRASLSMTQQVFPLRVLAKEILMVVLLVGWWVTSHTMLCQDPLCVSSGGKWERGLSVLRVARLVRREEHRDSSLWLVYSQTRNFLKFN
ncbi:hypothetical protein E2C01_026804 [Portunus trituberculatus]|uniref:Uncharacterized protein n=1 Tax=Portunus trituberculatus TaxID=210409 RepID=A0A5B7EM06_PORTR|nr:hypothetical protein [Portunus trituberculatus]